MQDSRLGFAMGRFFCRFLDPRSEQCPPEGHLLVDPCWDVEADDPALRYRNLADQLAQQLELNATPLASWLLARLWYLSAGSIQQGLKLTNGFGGADGGHYQAFAVVENDQQQGMAELAIEASPTYVKIIIEYRSLLIEPEEIVQTLAQTLLSQPSQLSICRIQIHDFEQPHRPKIYGWDGRQFLGRNNE